MKRKARKPFAIVSIFLVIMMVFTACGGNTTANQPTSSQPASTGSASPQPTDSQPASQSPEAPEVRPSIRMSYIGNEGFWTPYTYSSNSGFEILKLFYDKLFYYDEDLNIKPWLVKEYEISDDYTEYTLTIHDNATWHDGLPVTAEDVAFTYAYFAEDWKPRSRWTNPLKNVESVEVLDTYTVKITTKQPEYEFIRIPFTDTPIIPKHIWENVEDPFTFDGGIGDGVSGIIGSGPYKLVECEFDEYYRLVANDDHFLVTPNLEQIEIITFKDRNSEYSAFISKQIDLVGQGLTSEVVEQFINNPDITTGQSSGFTTTSMQANFDMYPFNIPEFNKAIAHLINVEEIIEVVWLGNAVPAYPSMVHPALSYFNPDQTTYEFSIEKANAILDELGFTERDADGVRKDDRGNRLEFENLTNSVNTQRIRAIELMGQDFLQAGIKMTAKPIETATYNGLTAPQSQGKPWGRDYEISISGPGQSYQMTSLAQFQVFHSDYYAGAANNLTGYNSPELDAMLEAHKAELDSQKRVELHKEIQAWIADNGAPYWPMIHPLDTYAYYADVYDGYVVKEGHQINHVLSYVTFK